MIKIQTKVGNLMNVTAGHIVHGCNAQGVMGSGVALAVKRKFPGAFTAYLTQYTQGGLKLGVAYPYQDNDELVIWNAITQDGYGSPTRNTSYDAIQTCFEEINETLNQAKSSHCELHIPYIGAGLGRGAWNIIRAIIEETMNYPVTVWSLDGKDPYGNRVEDTV